MINVFCGIRLRVLHCEKLDSGLWWVVYGVSRKLENPGGYFWTRMVRCSLRVNRPYPRGEQTEILWDGDSFRLVRSYVKE